MSLASAHPMRLLCLTVTPRFRLGRRMNPDKRDKQLADRALREGWDLARLLQELRQYNDNLPAPQPQSATLVAAGTGEKIELMEDRVAKGYAACHPADVRLDGDPTQALTATRNLNGSDTELEACDVRQFALEHGWGSAIAEVHKSRRISSLDKEAICDDILMEHDPDPTTTTKLRKIDELLTVMRSRKS